MKRNSNALNDCDDVSRRIRKKRIKLSDNREHNIVVNNTQTSFKWYAVHFQTKLSNETKKDTITVNLSKQGSNYLVFGFVRQYTQSSCMDISYIIVEYYHNLFEFTVAYPPLRDGHDKYGTNKIGFIDVHGIELETSDHVFPTWMKKNKVTMSLKLKNKVCSHEATQFGGYEIRVGVIGFRKNQLDVDNNGYLTKKDFFNTYQMINLKQRNDRIGFYDHTSNSGFNTFEQECMKNKGFKDYMSHEMIFRKYLHVTQQIEKILILRGHNRACEEIDKQIRLNWGETTVVTTVDLMHKIIEYSVVNSNSNSKNKEIIECDLLSDDMIYIFTFVVEGCDCPNVVGKGMTYELDIDYEKC